MTHSEQILEYIDGMLDPDAEQTLFDAMARQPELRSALRQFIVIGDAVRADREAYTPPAHVERALMSGLGLGPLAPPVDAAVAATAASGAGWLAKLSPFGKFWGMVLSFILGALLAGTTVLYIANDPTGEDTLAGRGAGQRAADGNPASDGRDAGVVPSQAGAGHEGRLQQGSGGVPSATAPGSGAGNGLNTNTTDRQADANRSGGRAAHLGSRSGGRSHGAEGGGGRVSTRSGGDGDGSGDYARSTIAQPPVERNGNPQQPDQTRTSIAPEITPAKLRDGEGSIEIPREPNGELIPSRTPDGYLDVTEPDYRTDADQSGTLALELRGNVGGAYNANNALRSPSSTDNLMLGGLWHTGNSFAVGAEIGRESYDQTLYYYDDDTLQVEQRPSYMWFGATGRFYIGEIPFGGMDAFLQGTLAYSAGGPVVRFRVGSEIPIAPRLDLSLGLETSGLVYTFNRQQFLSGRWGVTGGVQWSPW